MVARANLKEVRFFQTSEIKKFVFFEVKKGGSFFRNGTYIQYCDLLHLFLENIIKLKIRQVAQSDLIWVAALYDVVYFHQVFLTATQMCGNGKYRSFEQILTISHHMDKVER